MVNCAVTVQSPNVNLGSFFLTGFNAAWAPFGRGCLRLADTWSPPFPLFAHALYILMRYVISFVLCPSPTTCPLSAD
ncbi:hypothetical protein EDC04DRAFT_2714665 [Pisolithus marmoratus]|nr:hypothetical protein EDC04DRAFT_2714665 [Pisolithus marmoratus]